VPHLLAVGAVVPRKGFDVLVKSLVTLADLPWRLTIAGDLTRDPMAAARLRADIARHALTDRIVALGAVSSEQLATLYDSADLFVLASYFEGYGMAYTEALAHGLPVIGTKAGAIPETVPDGAGILVPAGDTAALAEALRLAITDGSLRLRLSEAAFAAASQLPTWSKSGAIFAGALERLRLP
jgi:glycosyltransferase involved in cell wall biosynthesis